MAITVCPVTQSFAAEIGDVDLAKPIPPDDFAAIKDAFSTYAVLIFPDQRLSPPQQIAFARRFGSVMVDPFIKSPDGHPELMIVIKEKDEKLAFGEGSISSLRASCTSGTRFRNWIP